MVLFLLIIEPLLPALSFSFLYFKPWAASNVRSVAFPRRSFPGFCPKNKELFAIFDYHYDHWFILALNILCSNCTPVHERTNEELIQAGVSTSTESGKMSLYSSRRKAILLGFSHFFSSAHQFFMWHSYRRILFSIIHITIFLAIPHCSGIFSVWVFCWWLHEMLLNAFINRKCRMCFIEAASHWSYTSLCGQTNECRCDWFLRLLHMTFLCMQYLCLLYSLLTTVKNKILKW